MKFSFELEYAFFELLGLIVGLLLLTAHFVLVLSFAFLNLEVQGRDGDFVAANEVRVFELLPLIRVGLLLKLAEEGIALRLQLGYLDVHELNLLCEVSILLNQLRVRRLLAFRSRIHLDHNVTRRRRKVEGGERLI